ncbi:MAG TPA: ankyrin repeat domain-containing protein [Candidatus Polarisedimenticolaceae bacterium]|nr:ankyrin repeat domain-containing protein [Candidatus Polarisedimenticolaceae bacterium]
MADERDPRAEFLEAAVWHGSLERAAAILAEHPEIASGDIYTAAVLGDDAAVRRFLAADPKLATAKSGAHGWEPLSYLCLSKYLRLDPARSDGFVRAATALLDAGADANTGFWTTGEHPEFETALYGAAGVAHHPELTRLLLERGADPNDVEVAYHAPESDDNRALQLVVQTGKLTADSLATMLLRKADWHDLDGARWLLEHGADPNRLTNWRFSALHQALRRDNDLAIVEAMLDHGADPALPNGVDGRTAISIAVRRGRADALDLFERRGIRIALEGVERLIAACARNDSTGVRAITGTEPHLVQQLLAEGGTLLAEFAGTANAAGVAQLLDLGVDVQAPYAGDGYFGIAKNSTALHVAAWRAWPAVVQLLIERGALLDLPDGNGRTPLALAVRACVGSYWSYRRSPESVEALLRAGASPYSVRIPSGYDAVDALIAAARGS